MGDRRGKRPARLGRGHHVALAEQQGCGHLDRRSSRDRVLIGVAGREIVEQHAVLAALEQPLRAAMHPHSRREATAEARCVAEPPDRDHVDRGVVVGFRGLQQIGADRHGRRGTDQH
jgi:hypothetical protein